MDITLNARDPVKAASQPTNGYPNPTGTAAMGCQKRHRQQSSTILNHQNIFVPTIFIYFIQIYYFFKHNFREFFLIYN